MTGPHSEATSDDDLIAVTALDCRFPGAPDTEAFWDLLISGRSGLTRLDSGENAAGAGRADPAHVPVSGLIDGQDQFDPGPFGLTDAEAAAMDPQQRLFLESCWRALERAGHGGGNGAGAVGVFAGAAHSDYLTRNLADRYADSAADPVGSLQAALGGVADYLPLHVAHRLGLTGPALAVGTACSTSLVAVHLAAQSLLAGECDTALAGGSSLIVPQGRGYRHVPDGIFSSDGRVRTFSAQGTGIVHTQGVGAAVLRRLRDALADGDPVLAVLHGSAVNNDGGDRTGFTAPSPRGQARAVTEALAVAGLEPADIGYVEAHGTATRLGDVVEVGALRRVFGDSGPAWCGLGSVKSNIGHANSAAGIAGFAKTVLALHHGQLPPTLDAAPLNPDLQLDDSPFTVVHRATAWPGQRYAGVSSFGIGGTNCHVILGSAPPRTGSPADPRPQLALLSAHRDDALASLAEATATAARQPGFQTADAAHTLHAGRAALSRRAAAVLTGDPSADARNLRTADRRAVSTPVPRIVFAFPGGGTQYPGMARELCAEETEFARTVEECAALFDDGVNPGLADLVTADPSDDAARRQLRDPAYGLPALFTVSLAAARTLMAWGVEPDAVVGHSLGEYAAAVVAGALTVADAAALVAVRSHGMSQAAGGGAMLTVPLSEHEVITLLRGHPELDLAAVNGPRTCVVAGAEHAVAALEAQLAGEDLRTVRLSLDAAAHSRLVDPVLPQLRTAAEAIAPRVPELPLATTLTGKFLHTEPGADHWVPHLRSVVRFSDALTTVLEDGPTAIVQTGPGSGLLQLARQQPGRSLLATLATFPDRDEPTGGRAALLSAAGALWTHGARLDASALHRPGRRRTALPGLPFQRRRLWIDPPERPRAGAGSALPARPAPDEREPLQLPVWHRVPGPGAAPLTGRWLVEGPENAPLTAAVREALTGAGARTVTLTEVERAPGEPCTGIVLLDPTDPGRSETGPADPGPSDTAAGGTDAGGRETDAADQVAASVMRYARVASAAAAWADRAVLLHLTTGSQQAESGDRPHPEGAAALALPRVLAQEFPGLRWRAVDLPAVPALPGALRAVCAEAADLAAGPANGVEAALRGTHRWVRGITPWRPSHEAPLSPVSPVSSVSDSGSAAPVRDGGIGTALVLGGLGDVGLALAAHLARSGRRVVVTGRTGLAADPAPGSVQAERADFVRRLRAEGADLEVCAVDAADPQATAALLHRLTERGALDLVVHAAGVVASAAVAPLRSTEPATVRDHLHAKVVAATTLRAALRRLPPERWPGTVVLMSSATAFVGGLGLGPYAAANRYLDALAEREHTADPGWPRWISVAWDGWRVGPGGTERVVASRHSIGLADGMRSVDRILALAAQSRAPASLAVSPADIAPRTAGSPPSVPVLPDSGAAPATAEGSGPRTAAERALAALWSQLLGFPVADRDADFFALGGHSLLATRMLARLRDDHGVELRLSDLLARPTVAALATLLPAADTPAADTPAADTPAADTPAPAPVAAVEPAGLPTGGTGHGDPGDFPLTRVQHAYWVGGSGGYRLGDVPCSFHLEYDCPGLDTARYEEAWNRVIARHPMLRAVISPEGRNRVLEKVPRYRIRVQDLTGKDPAERDRTLERIRDRMVRREPRPGRWPLVDIRAARLPGDVVRLFVNVDVLVCDTASYLVLDRELRALYLDPGAELPALTTTFAECVAALEKRAAGPGHARAAAYWRARADDLPGAPALPLREPGPGERPRFGRRTARLEPERWNALTAEAARRGLTPTAVLLAAYGDTLAQWSGQDRFTLTLTLFDRPAELPGADAVVGDFTSLMLHEVDRSADAGFADAATQAQRTLFEDLDHREFSALELLAEQSTRTGRSMSVPVVFTSALGLSGPLGGGHDLDWAGTPVHGVSSTPQTWLDHQVIEQHGALLLQWDVLESAVPPEEADRAFDAYVARVRSLADGPARWDTGPRRFTASPTAPAAPPGTPSAGPVEVPTPQADEDVALLLRDGDGRRPLFLMHPSGGDVLCYGELAGLLGDGRPVVALTDPALTGGTGPSGIPEMADRYLAALRPHQPHGPYLLGGWSMGGTVAHEMAAELERRGERTDLLVLVDSNTPDRIRHLGGTDRAQDSAIAALRYLHSLEAFLDLDLGLGGDADVEAALRDARTPRDFVTERLRDVGLIGARESADTRLAVFERHLRALGEHRAAHLTDPVTRALIVAADRPSPRNAGVGMGVDDAPDLPALGWRPHLRGPVQEETVEGHHYSLLSGPAAVRVAALVDRALAALPPGG
ncbi:SDR family NAD(P)-dependent oxidoreductase [Streptomyces sp. 549]|uniref:type I polyketide synthase n=1 Tax=Streptomyces sp. 549 TaxID=3049076 RepID=UPI0024C2932B|nr:type I polyketide synthase [Streptomyces sp. 549]MDK1474483.1 SDR family NAD(P)-dependent oxidoreductase [Streptomyces sp. 549]